MNAISQLIISLEQSRCAAMCSADLTALDTLLDVDLYFSHATGAVDDKVAYLDKMAQGLIVYRSIEWSEQSVALLPGEGSALLCGRMTSSVAVNGVEKQLDNRVLGVWIKTAGVWRLRALQTTPLPKT